MDLLSARDSFYWLKALWNHARNMRRTRADIVAAQERKFRKLVRFVNDRSPFYREIVAERGIDLDHCRPQDFPVIAKNDVIENFDRIATDPRVTRARIAEFLSQSTDPNELLDNRFHVVHTSGTSGTMGYYVYSREEWIQGCSHITRTAPPRLRKRVAYVAATRGHFAGASLTMTGNRGTNRLFYNIRPFDVGLPVPQLIRELNAFQPHVLSGYAAMLKVLAELQQEGRLQIRPRQITNGGEMLNQETKELLERAFEAPVINAYANSEHLYMGLTLGGSEGLHLLEDDLIFELRDDHTCVTNLYNYTLPLIHYRIDDVLVADQTPSRYPFTKVREVVGRYEDALVFTNRFGQQDFIHPLVIVDLMIGGLRTWQIELLDLTTFIFRARFEPGLNDVEKQKSTNQIRDTMRSILAEKSMDNVKFRIDEVDHIPVDPRTGKFRIVLRPGRLQEAAAA